MDPLSRRRFWDLIYDMADQGITVFVTTHYMKEAEYCDRIALIYKGRMIAMGTPMELKTRYMHEQILDIRCDRPQEMVQHLAYLPGVRDASLFGAGLHVVTMDAILAETQVRQKKECAHRVMGSVQKPSKPGVAEPVFRIPLFFHYRFS